MEHQEAPVSKGEGKPLELKEGDVLYHFKTGNQYGVLSSEDHYFSEATDLYGGVEDPTELPMVHYQALYGDKKKWFRPRFMFTDDRFAVLYNVRTVGK